VQCERHPWITLQGSVYGAQYCPECSHEKEVEDNAREANEASRLLLESQMRLEELGQQVAQQAEQLRQQQEEYALLREGLPEFDEAFQRRWGEISDAVSTGRDYFQQRKKDMEAITGEIVSAKEALIARFCKMSEERSLKKLLPVDSPVPGDGAKVEAFLNTVNWDKGSSGNEQGPLCALAETLEMINEESDTVEKEVWKPSVGGFLVPGIVSLCLAGLCTCVGGKGTLLNLFAITGVGLIALLVLLSILCASIKYSRQQKKEELNRMLSLIREALGFSCSLSGCPGDDSFGLVDLLAHASIPVFVTMLHAKGDAGAKSFFGLSEQFSEKLKEYDHHEGILQKLENEYGHMKGEILRVGKAIREGRRTRGLLIKLLKCPSCAGSLSSESRVCPYCGSAVRVV
jgi:hypothetical protein